MQNRSRPGCLLPGLRRAEPEIVNDTATSLVEDPEPPEQPVELDTAESPVAESFEGAIYLRRQKLQLLCLPFLRTSATS